MVAQEFIERGFAKNQILTWCSVARSSFYYQPTTGLRGRKPYAIITNQHQQVLKDEAFIAFIEKL